MEQSTKEFRLPWIWRQRSSLNPRKEAQNLNQANFTDPKSAAGLSYSGLHHSGHSPNQAQTPNFPWTACRGPIVIYSGWGFYWWFVSRGLEFHTQLVHIKWTERSHDAALRRHGAALFCKWKSAATARNCEGKQQLLGVSYSFSTTSGEKWVFAERDLWRKN